MKEGVKERIKILVDNLPNDVTRFEIAYDMLQNGRIIINYTIYTDDAMEANEQ